jgi:uncharacterized membrane protein YoaT (DUF817 family)
MQAYRHKVLAKLQKLPLASFWIFGLKQAWCAVFGGLMLAAVIITKFVPLPGLARYDWLFLTAIGIQLMLLLTKLEKPHEVITIVCFHLVGLGMEVFKTSASIGSWSYPGHAFFHVANVPLFSGFMYAAVGSYIARAWRVFHLRFTGYPPRWTTIILALAIYINFFSHHYVWDFRILLFAALAGLYINTKVYFENNQRTRHMPLLLGLVLISFFIWVGENIGTITRAWIYPSQAQHWHMVSLQKLGSWLLLMAISFIMIELMHHQRSKSI